MAAVTIRNLPDEVHRTLKVRAARNNRSTEAEMRAILAAAARAEGKVGLGTRMMEVARRAGVSDEDVDQMLDNIRSARDGRTPEPISFD